MSDLFDFLAKLWNLRSVLTLIIIGLALIIFADRIVQALEHIFNFFRRKKE